MINSKNQLKLLRKVPKRWQQSSDKEVNGQFICNMNMYVPNSVFLGKHTYIHIYIYIKVGKNKHFIFLQGMITKWIVESYWVKKKVKKPIVGSEKVEVLGKKKKKSGERTQEKKLLELI